MQITIISDVMAETIANWDTGSQGIAVDSVDLQTETRADTCNTR